MISAKEAINNVLRRLDTPGFDFGSMFPRENAMIAALDGVADMERGGDSSDAIVAFLLAAFTLAGNRKVLQGYLDALTIDEPVILH